MQKYGRLAEKKIQFHTLTVKNGSYEKVDRAHTQSQWYNILFAYQDGDIPVIIFFILMFVLIPLLFPVT